MSLLKWLFVKLNGQEIRVRGLPKQKTPPDGGVDTDGFNVTIRYLPGLKKPVVPFSVLVINNAVLFGCDHEIEGSDFGRSRGRVT